MSQDASSSPSSQPSSSWPLLSDIAALQAIILKKHEQHAHVVAQQQVTISQLVETNTEYRQSIEHLGHRITQFLRQQYGPRREHINPDQLTLFTPDELEALAKEMSAKLTDHPTIPDAVLSEEDAKTAMKRRKMGRKSISRRRVLPAHLPREQRMHELMGSDLKCPCCARVY